MTPRLSLVTPRSTQGDPRADGEGRLSRGDLRTSTAVTIAVAVALAATGFITAGGVDEAVASGRNTWTEIALDVLGAIAVGVGIFRRPPGRRFGLVTAALMAVLFALGAVSIAWSVAPDSSWLASGQMLAYLAVFAAGAALARPLARHWRALLGGIVLWASAICLWSLIAKVFPATLSVGAQYGRLQAPFGYWNAVASVAAMGVPCCLWLGARRDGGRHLAALAAPALTLCVAVLVLSYSRSADLAAVIAAAAWVIVVPLRLRAIVIAAVGLLGGGVISVWGLTHHGITGDGVAIAVQDHAGHILGIVVLVVLVLITVIGVAVTESMDRADVAPETRRRVGAGLIAGVVALIVVAVVGVALSHRGLTGEISHGWHQLTNPAATVSATSASRVFQFGSSRPTYWHEALQVGDHAVLKGVGLDGFSVARLLYPGNPEVVYQAHGYVFQVYADLGVIGLLVVAALLLSWLLATGRTLGLRGARATQPERIGTWSLAALVLAFGVQSTLDWTWFFTGVAAPALLVAGWVAGRGPVFEPVPGRAPNRSPLDRPGALMSIPLLVAVLLLGAWLTWRPLHSANLVNQAENTGSFAAARSAQQADPFALLPYQVLSDLELSARSPERARAELERATREQPHNPQSWAALAAFLVQRHLWQQAIPPADRVKALDVTGDQTAVTNDQLIVAIAAHLRARSRH